MKKIILILTLALGVKVNAQVVGGYLPVNSSKSFTAGNATFSNVIARGTLSVGSTATVTGNARVTGSLIVVGQASIGVGQTNYHGAIVSSQLESTSNGYIGNKLRVGGVATPVANLDVTGTMSVSSTSTLQAVKMTSLTLSVPTSSSGLTTGQVWSNSGVLTVVP